MLQFIRNLFKSRIAIALFGVLVAVAFLFFGIEGYFGQHSATWVAKVDGHKISQQEFTTALSDYRAQQLDQPDNMTTATGSITPAVKQHVLTQLIDRQLLLGANEKFGIVVSDSALRAQIASFPTFQVNGKFDPATYRAWLAQQGKTAQEFQHEVRNDLAVQALPAVIADTAFATKQEVDSFLRLQLQERDFAYVKLPPPPPTAAQSKVSDAAVAAYYKQHRKAFLQPERISVNYVDLDAAKIKATPNLSAKALRALYAKEKARFVVPPQWEVSHILVKLPAKPTAAEKDAALAKAEKIDALARRPGADFAALARKYSDDLGSKRQGGSLGWLQPGDVGPQFEAALKRMKKGQISGPVLASDGYHIIDLRNVRGGHTKTFADVRGRLVREATRDARTHAYRKVANELTNLIYGDSISLRAAAAKLGLSLRTTPLFGRKGAKDGLAANAEVVKAAFSNLVLVQGSTSNPINLGNGHMVLIHLNKVVPAAPAPLDRVGNDPARHRARTGRCRRTQARPRGICDAQRWGASGYARQVRTATGPKGVAGNTHFAAR